MGGSYSSLFLLSVHWQNENEEDGDYSAVYTAPRETKGEYSWMKLNIFANVKGKS